MDSRSSIASRADVAHESVNPLFPGNHSQSEVGLIQHKGSVYTYMLLMPPLARLRYGHYCSAEVLMAFALFCAVILLQLSLTFIAGYQIHKDFNDFQTSLVQDNDQSHIYQLHSSMTMGGVLEQWDRVRQEATEQVEDKMDRIGRKVGKVGRSIGLDLPKEEQSNNHLRGAIKISEWAASLKDKPGNATGKCCIGSSCSGQGMYCCPPAQRPAAVGEGAARQPHSFAHVSLEGLLLREVFGRKPGGGGKAKASPNRKEKAVQKTNAICTKYATGTLACVPPSFDIGSLWEDLDKDGDGRWTLEEAKEDASNLGCFLGVHIEDVFWSACRGLLRDAADSREHGGRSIVVPYSVKRRRAIPRGYFEWWQGLLGLCVHTDAALCHSMVSSGMFDGAMDPRNNGTRGGVVDLDTAIGYCNRLLAPGGICEASLPGTYVMFRSHTQAKCGTAVFESGHRYPNPHNPHDVLQTMTVSYTNLNFYGGTHNPNFLFFMFLVLVLWYISIVDELKDIIILWDYVKNCEVENVMPLISAARGERMHKWYQKVGERLGRLHPRLGFTYQKESRLGQCTSKLIIGEAPHRDADAGDIEIETIGRPHHVMCMIMAVLRTLLLVYLGMAGTVFLISNRTYMDLLLNSLAMVFIFEIDEFLYVFLVPEETKEVLDSAKPIKYSSSLPKKGYCSLFLSKYMWGLTVIPIVSIYHVLSNDAWSTVPVLEALNCLCLMGGEHCSTAGMTDVEWWNSYWSRVARL